MISIILLVAAAVKHTAILYREADRISRGLSLRLWSRERSSRLILKGSHGYRELPTQVLIRKEVVVGRHADKPLIVV